jgi:hypothetical protein
MHPASAVTKEPLPTKNCAATARARSMDCPSSLSRRVPGLTACDGGFRQQRGGRSGFPKWVGPANKASRWPWPDGLGALIAGVTHDSTLRISVSIKRACCMCVPAVPSAISLPVCLRAPSGLHPDRNGCTKSSTTAAGAVCATTRVTAVPIVRIASSCCLYRIHFVLDRFCVVAHRPRAVPRRKRRAERENGHAVVAARDPNLRRERGRWCRMIAQSAEAGRNVSWCSRTQITLARPTQSFSFLTFRMTTRARSPYYRRGSLRSNAEFWYWHHWQLRLPLHRRLVNPDSTLFAAVPIKTPCVCVSVPALGLGIIGPRLPRTESDEPRPRRRTVRPRR